MIYRFSLVDLAGILRFSGLHMRLAHMGNVYPSLYIHSRLVFNMTSLFDLRNLLRSLEVTFHVVFGFA